MSKIIFLVLAFMAGNAFADASLVTCPEWNKKFRQYADHPKKKEVIGSTAPKDFIHLYRAISAILGSGRMSEEANAALEESGYGDLFDLLLSLHYRGGLPPDFIEAVKLFQKKNKLDEEAYTIDTKTQEMLGKFRRAYCK